jgi:hypothetical protein
MAANWQSAIINWQWCEWLADPGCSLSGEQRRLRDSLLKILPSRGKSYALLLATFSTLPQLVESLLPSAVTSTLLAPSFL